jgi:hypothetical protein
VGTLNVFMFWVFDLFLYLPYVLSPYRGIQANHIAAFALDLKSTYEGKHMIFGLLSLTDLAQNDGLQRK